MNRIILAAAAAIASVPSVASAASVGPYTDLVVFGDSLSDAGNAAILAPAEVPAAIYPEGQFTNGAVWAAQLGTAPSVPGGLNYAVGGAQASGGSPLIRFDAQRQAFADADPTLGARPLAAVWFGGNDLRAAIDPTDPLGSAGALPGAIDAATSAIVDGVDALVDDGLTEFLVFGLPNLARLPDIASLPDAFGGSLVRDAVEGASVAYNDLLRLRLDGVDPLADVMFFDTFSFLEEIIADADEIGIDTIEGRCVTEEGTCGIAAGNDFLFYDAVHPSEVVHTQFAQAVRSDLEAVVPVPLPAGLGLLAAAFGGLAVLRSGALRNT